MFKRGAFANYFLQKMLRIPFLGRRLKAKIDAEITNSLAELKAGMVAARENWEPIRTLPEIGLSATSISDHFALLQKHYKPGRSSSTVYTEYDENLSQLLQQVWQKTALTNPLYPQWPLINLLEAELISICQCLLNGKSGAPGMVTHGGSMAILEACKAYVLQARKKGIKEPEILVPENIHISFDKAAAILNARLIKISLNRKTGTIKPRWLKKYISKNTCLIAASAPSFPCGVMDPIAEIAAIAKNYKVPMHVDSCLGGFVTVFAQEAGFTLPPCDFSVPGVTSISVGTHKYGQTPNGSTVLLFNEDCEATPTHVYLDWMGGIYASPGIDGTRSGADIATAWAVLCYKGKNEYIRETKLILELKEKIVSGLKTIDGIYIPYTPQLTIIPIFTRWRVNPLLVASRLHETHGWSVNLLQNSRNKALGFHFCLTAVHARQSDFCEVFITSLTEAVDHARKNPNNKPTGLASAYVKLEKGVPAFIKEKMGRAYVRMFQSL